MCSMAFPMPSRWSISGWQFFEKEMNNGLYKEGEQ